MKCGSEIILETEEKILVPEKEQNTEAEDQNKENRQQDEKDASGTARLFFRYSCSSYMILFLSKKCKMRPVQQTETGKKGESQNLIKILKKSFESPIFVVQQSVDAVKKV